MQLDDLAKVLRTHRQYFVVHYWVSGLSSANYRYVLHVERSDSWLKKVQKLHRSRGRPKKTPVGEAVTFLGNLASIMYNKILYNIGGDLGNMSSTKKGIIVLVQIHCSWTSVDKSTIENNSNDSNVLSVMKVQNIFQNGCESTIKQCHLQYKTIIFDI